MRTKRIEITLPTYPSIFDEFSVEKIKSSLSTLFLEGYNAAQQGFSSRRSSLSRLSGFGKKMPKINWGKTLRIVIPVVGIILLGGVVWAAFSPKEDTQAVAGISNEAPKAFAEQTLNKKYSFSVKDGEEELTKFDYAILDAKLQKQIIVQGQRATAVSGRMFLLLDIKLANTYKKALSINTRDYIRVKLDGNDKELLAPDIHNDPVEVQAISTKPTRLGLSIDENVKSIELKVGEIDGKKETIKLDLTK